MARFVKPLKGDALRLYKNIIGMFDTVTNATEELGVSRNSIYNWFDIGCVPLDRQYILKYDRNIDIDQLCAGCSFEKIK